MKTLLIMISLIPLALSEEGCARLAYVNSKEVLLETVPNKKGEGLRYHMKKDRKAEGLLNLYQERSRPTATNLVLGTTGTAIFLAGLAKSGSITDHRLQGKRALILGGLSLILVNILISKTQQKTNERLLYRAIEEYNKRNLPKIYFSPYASNQEDKFSPVIGIEKSF